MCSQTKRGGQNTLGDCVCVYVGAHDAITSTIRGKGEGSEVQKKSDEDEWESVHV